MLGLATKAEVEAEVDALNERVDAMHAMLKAYDKQAAKAVGDALRGIGAYIGKALADIDKRLDAVEAENKRLSEKIAVLNSGWRL